jgi:hypothetical protein
VTQQKRATILSVVAISWLLIACAGAATQRSSGRENRNRLTQEQLAATSSENLYDAIVKLRPEWVTSRGPTSVTDPTPTMPSVFLGGNMLGRADYLREMRVLDVTEVRYWEAGPASARFGMGHPRGVIEVTRR